MSMTNFSDVFKDFEQKGIEAYVSIGERKGFAGKVKSVGDDYVEISGVTGSRFYNFSNIIYTEATLGHKKKEPSTDIF